MNHYKTPIIICFILIQGNFLKPAYATTADTLYQETIHLWENNEWNQKYKIVEQYNTKGQISSEIFFMLNGTQWDSTEKKEMFYNSFDSLSKTVMYYYDVNLWIGYEQDIYYYDSLSKLLDVKLNQYWDDSSNTWLNNKQSSYFYGVTLNDSIRIDSIWENNTWIPESKQLFFYDSLNNVIEENGYVWNVDSFKNTRNDFYTYTNSSILKNWMLQADIYGVVGKLYNYQSTSYSYDSSMYLIKEYAEVDTFGNNNWRETTQTFITNNTNGSPIEKITQIKETNEWTNDNKRTYLYNKFLSVQDQYFELNKNINVYPNPAQTFLNINYFSISDIYQINIYDALGKFQKTACIFPNCDNKINIDYLNPGIYFLKFINKNKTNHTLKFIKN